MTASPASRSFSRMKRRRMFSTCHPRLNTRADDLFSNMNTLPHIPALRRGRAYESLDQIKIVDHRNGAPLVSISQVNAGIIRKDLARVGESRAALKKFTTAQLIAISAKAGGLFLDGTLPLG